MVFILLYTINYYSLEPFVVETENPDKSLINNEIKQYTLPTTIIANIDNCIDINKNLSQYAIKGSYNSANSGTYISTNAIEYVLQRGCRFLDFEVYIDEYRGASATSPEVAIVAYSSTTINNIINTNTIKLDSKNLLLLDDVLMTCVTKAFLSNICPNYGDPLFIQLRLKTGNSSLKPIVNSIEYSLLPRLYMDYTKKTAIKVNETTKLNNIMGKIVLVIDTGLNTTDITLIEKYINVLSNTSNWKKYYYRNIDNMPIVPPTIDNNNLCSQNNLSMILPSSTLDIKIPSPFSVFAEHGIQTLLIPFFSVNNENIIIYEQLFNTLKGGIVPFSNIISYSNDMISSQSQTQTELQL